MDALIGTSGYVGSTLLRQRPFDRGFRSSDIHLIRGQRFDDLVCAGAPGAKWIADRAPQDDLVNLRRLAEHLGEVSAERVILISTIDVFADSRGADEETPPSAQGLSGYGANRLWFEGFVRERFPNALIVRLPALVGPGLRKNAVFDLHNDNRVSAIDSRSTFQIYPAVNLWPDVDLALRADLRLAHFTAQPVSVEHLASEGFDRDFRNECPERPPARYDMHTRHADVFGAAGPYIYSARESMTAVRAYAQSEPLT